MSTSYKRYVLASLTLVYMLNYLDRGAIILLLQPIKQDLGLSDTKLGFLTGIAFGLFYATLGLPIARWADRGNRVTIISAAIALWGLAVMSCLRVATFSQLILARVGAAVGESGCMPPTYSLVGDYFPGPVERTRAMSIYWLASPLAALISFVLGGWLSAHYGWRTIFFLMGIPALLSAALVKLTVVEPRTHLLSQQTSSKAPQPATGAVMRSLWRQRSSRHLSIAIVLLFTLALGLAPWYAAFLMRSHNMGTGELGLWLGIICGVGGIAGILLGGYAAAHWFANSVRAQMRMTAVAVAALIPCFILFLLLPEKRYCLLALVPLQIVFNLFFGPTFALLQRLVAAEVRATTLAIVMLLANLIGMGLGPQVVGVLSDLLTSVFGVDSLRYAMLFISLLAGWAAYHFWQVGLTAEEDLAAIDGPTQESPGNFERLEAVVRA